MPEKPESISFTVEFQETNHPDLIRVEVSAVNGHIILLCRVSYHQLPNLLHTLFTDELERWITEK
jgi:hypothetical protein